MDTSKLVRLVNMVMKEVQPRRCKYCGSAHVVCNGHSKHRQRLLCRECRHTFMDDDAIPGMRTPRDQIASALGMYYEGMSLNAIRRQLEQMHRNYPSDSTVYDWITRFTEVAVKQAAQYKPDVGDVWIADETVLKIEGKKLWFWDIIDAKTRFLLASRISTTRTTRDARMVMQKAAERAGKAPKVVVTDKLSAYPDGIERAFGADTKHIASKGFRVQPNTNLVERFHSTLKARTKVMRGLKARESAKLLTDGWLVHYNFFRPHEALGNRTPAEKAGISFPFRNWLDVTNSPIVTHISVKPRTMRMKLAVPRSAPIGNRPPRRPTGAIYEGRGMVARRPFSGGKRRKGRLIP